MGKATEVVITQEGVSILEVSSPGVQGQDGVDGVDGTGWFTGDGVPAAGLGADGDHYRDKLTNDLYFKESGSWLLVTDLDSIDAGFY